MRWNFPSFNSFNFCAVAIYWRVSPSFVYCLLASFLLCMCVCARFFSRSFNFIENPEYSTYLHCALVTTFAAATARALLYIFTTLRCLLKFSINEVYWNPRSFTLNISHRRMLSFRDNGISTAKYTLLRKLRPTCSVWPSLVFRSVLGAHNFCFFFSCLRF